MTPRQVELVQTTWNTVIPISDQVTALFYGRRHEGCSVKEEHYDTVGAALLWTLEKGPGGTFAPEVKEAGAITYAILATALKNAAITAPV